MYSSPRGSAARAAAAGAQPATGSCAPPTLGGPDVPADAEVTASEYGVGAVALSPRTEAVPAVRAAAVAAAARAAPAVQAAGVAAVAVAVAIAGAVSDAVAAVDGNAVTVSAGAAEEAE